MPSQWQLLPNVPYPLPTLGTYPRCLKFVLSHHFIEQLLCASYWNGTTNSKHKVFAVNSALFQFKLI